MNKASTLTFTRILLTFAFASSVAQASILFDTTTALTLSNPTQTGRLNRAAIPQDWAGSELFPGVLNTTTVYHYTTFSVNVGPNSFIQIDMDSVSLNTFVSAYDTGYLPDSAGTPNFGFNTNWLGDAGFSGNPAPNDPAFFQVIIPANHNVVVVVNNTAASNVGVGDPFHLTVEGFLDTSFDEVPEPSSFLLLIGGIAVGAGVLRRKPAGPKLAG